MQCCYHLESRRTKVDKLDLGELNTKIEKHRYFRSRRPGGNVGDF